VCPCIYNDDNDGKVGILIVLANSTTNNEQTNLPCACVHGYVCVCVCVIRGYVVRERAGPCVTTVCACMFPDMCVRVYVCRICDYILYVYMSINRN